jgi:hypothetical protein
MKSQFDLLVSSEDFRKEIAEESVRIERNEEIEILKIVGSRMPGSGKELSDYYCDSILDKSSDNVPILTLSECENLIKRDEAYEYYINKFIRKVRDCDTIPQVRAITERMHELVA